MRWDAFFLKKNCIVVVFRPSPFSGVCGLTFQLSLQRHFPAGANHGIIICAMAGGAKVYTYDDDIDTRLKHYGHCLSHY
ncbi:hypothetical protein KCP73_17510 [Salmonella enterica subsp. enterica]|nr:hypothetical protein KCP73_17510 [Salmonella enterica subsp. enterica]